MRSFDLVIRNARLRRTPQPVEIGIAGDRIAPIDVGLPHGTVEVDAGGLVTESFVNPQLHLDKVYTLPMLARAMALHDKVYLREARIAVVTDPHTGPLHVPVDALMGTGITVCLGQDDISDAYHPYGRHNMAGSGLPRRPPALDAASPPSSAPSTCASCAGPSPVTPTTWSASSMSAPGRCGGSRWRTSIRSAKRTTGAASPGSPRTPSAWRRSPMSSARA